ILSIRVISRLRAAFGVAVSPRAVFSTPTVAGLAEVITTDSRPDDGIPATQDAGPLPLSLAQQRLWFLHEFEPDSTEYLSPVGRRRSRAAPDDAPHHHRRLVVRGAHRRAERALPWRHAAAAPDSVRRLRGVATKLPHRCGGRGAVGLLAPAAERRPGRGAADR